MKKTFIKSFIAILIMVLSCSACALLFTSCNTNIDNESTLLEEEDAFWQSVSDEKIEDGSTPVKVAVIADLHLLAESQIEDLNGKSYNNHLYYDNIKRMEYASEAVLKTAVDNIIDAKPDVAVFLGDLTANKAVCAMQVVADECARLEANGITVIVTGGLADNDQDANCVKYTTDKEVKVDAASQDDYKRIFNDFGLGEAVMKDANSLSYLVEIPSTDYCALVIDTASNFKSSMKLLDDASFTTPKTSDGQLDWLETALQYCEKNGKTPFVVSYFPLSEDVTDYLGYASLGRYFPLDKGEDVLELLAKYDVHTVLSAHIHAENKHVYEINGKTVTELSTACLTAYPSPIKYVKIYNTASSSRSVFMSAVKEQYIPSCVSAENKALLASDLASFAKTALIDGLTIQASKNVLTRGSFWPSSVLFFLDTFGLYFPGSKDPTKQASNAACLELSDAISSLMINFNSIKIYGEGNTIESVCTEYGITLPRSKYENCTVLEMVLEMIYAMQDGSYVYERGNAEMQLLIDIFKVGVKQLCDMDLFEIFTRISPDILYCDMSVMGDTVMTSNTIDLKADDLLLSAASVLIPYLKELKLSALIPLVQANSSQELIDRFAGFMPFLVAIIPNFVYFTNENLEFETSYVSISKGEIYCTAFAEDLLVDVIARTAILE